MDFTILILAPNKDKHIVSTRENKSQNLPVIKQSSFCTHNTRDLTTMDSQSQRGVGEKNEQETLNGHFNRELFMFHPTGNTRLCLMSKTCPNCIMHIQEGGYILLQNKEI